MNSSRHDIERVSEVFRHSLKALGADPSDESLAVLANLIEKSMSNECRHFHRVSHALELIDLKDPILTLAALFHDLVYYQVDQSVPVLANEILKPLIQEDDLCLTMSEQCLILRPHLGIVFDLFEVAPGQTLNPAKGLNEFLSAVVAYEALTPFLNRRDLLKICVCIEATIPFRANHNGVWPMADLEETLRRCNSKYKTGLKESTIVNTIKRATKLANRDVQNFASNDPAVFLSSTWLLLPERNECLRDDYYTFKDYRTSLQKMEHFFLFLTPELVFRKFRDFPTAAVHKKRLHAAANNIAVARTYLKIKVIATGLLEALANTAGCDLPISMMLGKVQQDGQIHLQIENFLPKSSGKAKTDAAVMRLLQEGRAVDASFDLRNSPLAAFIYQQLGDEGIEALVSVSHKFFAGEIQSAEYLSVFPKAVLATVAQASAEVFSKSTGEPKKHIA